MPKPGTEPTKASAEGLGEQYPSDSTRTCRNSRRWFAPHKPVPQITAIGQGNCNKCNQYAAKNVHDIMPFQEEDGGQQQYVIDRQNDRDSFPTSQEPKRNEGLGDMHARKCNVVIGGNAGDAYVIPQ